MINTIPCSPGEIERILDEAYKLREALFLWGEPGVGKSDMVKHFVRKKSMQLVDLRLTTMDSPDLRGLMWINEEKGVTQWYRPEFFPVDDKPGIIFLDERTAADQRMQATTYQLVLDRCVGPHRLPDSWWVVGAGNSPEDGAISYRMGSALADRFIHLYIVPDAKDWIKWATEKGVHPHVISFIQVKPDFLNSVQGQKKTDQLISPSPRSWERVSNILKSTKSDKTVSILINGLIGEAAAVEFFQVIQEIAELPKIEDLLRAPAARAVERVPKKIAALYGLTYSLLAFCETTVDFTRAIDLLDALADVGDGLPRAEIQTLGMELILEKALKRGLREEIANSAAYQRYVPKAEQLVGA